LRAWPTASVMDAQWPTVKSLVAARVSGLPVDTLFGVGGDDAQMQVLTRAAEGGAAFGPEGEFRVESAPLRASSLTVSGAAISVLPMRLNGDAVNDLVVLAQGVNPVQIMMGTPSAIITVNSAADTNVRDN